MNEESAKSTITTLDNRMVALIDLQLTLKQIHWNVVGSNFIGVIPGITLAVLLVSHLRSVAKI